MNCSRCVALPLTVLILVAGCDESDQPFSTADLAGAWVGPSWGGIRFGADGVATRENGMGTQTYTGSVGSQGVVTMETIAPVWGAVIYTGTMSPDKQTMGGTWRYADNSGSGTWSLGRMAPCAMEGDGVTATLNDGDTFDFDTGAVGSWPTPNNNLIYWFSGGGPVPGFPAGELWLGTYIGGSATASTMSISAAGWWDWELVCPDEPDTYDELPTSDGPYSLYNPQDIHVVCLADGVTYLKLQIVSLGDTAPFPLTIYYEVHQAH